MKTMILTAKFGLGHVKASDAIREQILSRNPKADVVVIDFISYAELRELAYMGASVMHEDAVFPVRKAGIPINIRNTNAPTDAGTMIVPTLT